MLTDFQKAYLIETKAIDADTLERVLQQDDPTAGLLSKLSGALDFKFRALIKLAGPDHLDEFNRELSAIAFLTRLPLDLDITFNHVNHLKGVLNSDCEQILYGLYMQGAALDSEMLELSPPVACDQLMKVLQRWDDTQKLTSDDYYLDETVWQNICTIHDIDNPSLSGKFNAHANAVQTSDNLYVQAARAGQFAQVLDIYKKSDRPLPIKLLLDTDVSDGITLFEVICFKQENGIFEKLLDPALWRGQHEDLSLLWHECLPEIEKQKRPLENLLQDAAQDAAARITHQCASKPLARRR